MALQVWLPLTRDLRNQGLASITSSGTPVFKNNGKLGSKSLDLKTRISFSCSTMANKIVFSIAFWAKVNVDSSLTGNWVDVIGFTDVSTSGTNGQLRWETCYGSTSYRGSTYNQAWNISSHDNATYATAQMSSNPIQEDKGKWHHYVFTTNGVQAIEYRDGTVYANYTGNGGHLNGSFWCGQTNAINGEIQDVRIYDHCLSPTEVKELSKGLVLHYPLNRGGWGQENLLPVNGSTIINSTQSFEFQGWVQNFYTKTWMNEHLTPGKQYTLSYTVTCLSIPDSTYTFKENRHSPILVHQGNGWNQVTITSDGIKNTNMAVGQSRDYKCTFIFATASENYEYYGLCGYTALYRNSSNNAQYAKFRIDNLKLEEGSITTPWCPNSSDNLADEIGLNSIIEYDASGYCNNGTKNNISYTSDTPKYAVSSVFNGSNSYIKVNDNNWMIKGMSEMTVNLWAKATTWPTNGGRLLSCTESGGFNLEGGNSGYWRFSIYVYTNSGQTSSAYKYDSNEIKIADLIPDEWNMITLVYDNTGTKTYLNGKLHHTYTNTSYGINFNTNARLFLGCEANTANPSAPYFNGKESDFRIYATALSASDVKSLYQNCVTIDPDGTIRGKIR